ncbi:MAG TPA: IucA/IucC family protein, partial [Mycobacteriales bacterium]
MRTLLTIAPSSQNESPARPYGHLDGQPDGQPGDARMHAVLRSQAPELADAFMAHLPRARAMTTRRLLAAVWREDVAGLRTTGRILPDPACDPTADHAIDPALAGLLAEARPGTWAVCGLPDAGTLAFPVLAEHAFGRITVGHPVLHLCDGVSRPICHPGELVSLLAGTQDEHGWDGLAAELADSATNLALALARAGHTDRANRRRAAALGAVDTVELAGLVGATDPVFDPTVFLEKLSTGGHNLHPCARTRLGMGPADLLRHDLEATEPTVLTLVGLRRDQAWSTPDPHGRDVGELLLGAYPGLASAVAEAGVDRQEYLFL